MSTPELRKLIDSDKLTKEDIPDMLGEIAFQLSRRNDLIELQMEYDKFYDEREIKRKEKTDSTILSLGQTVKQGMDFLAPPFVGKPTRVPVDSINKIKEDKEL